MNTNPETGKQRLEELRNEIPLPVLELYKYAGEACGKGDYLEAEKVALEGVTLAMADKSEAGRLWCLHILGNALFYLGKLAESRKTHLEALSLCQKLVLPSGIASSLNNLGLIDKEEGYFYEARKKFEKSISIYNQLGSSRESVVEKHLCDMENSNENTEPSGAGQPDDPSVTL